MSGHQELNEFRKIALEKHNRYRTLHSSPPLELDNAMNKYRRSTRGQDKFVLQRYAQEWANHLAKNGRLEHRPEQKYGENCFMYGSSALITITGDKPVEDWYNEVTAYNFSNATFTSGTGHFTQVIWKDSKKLGVGCAYTTDMKSVYVVANYDPAGNIVGGDRFQKNVLPTTTA